MTTPLIDRVCATVAATLNLPKSKVTPETSAETDESWDSLAQVNLMLAIEQTFGVEVDIEDFLSLTSVQGIARYLQGQGVG
jgi:acyl carrier protein